MKHPYAAIAFLTYEDLEPGIRFYGEVLGLPLIEDQGWARVYRISGAACVGLVSSRGPAIETPIGAGVLLSIVVDDVASVDAWHERLRCEPGIELTSEPAMVAGIPVYSFFLRDPGGYAVEIQAFTDPATVTRFRSD